MRMVPCVLMSISPHKGLVLSRWRSVLGKLPLPTLWPRRYWDLGFAMRQNRSLCEPAAGPLLALGLWVRDVNSLVLSHCLWGRG